MQRYILRRLLQMIPLLAGILLLVFLLLASAPGDPVDLLISSNPSVNMEDTARLKRIYGPDQPIIVQYAKWLGRTLRGDLGWSLSHKVPAARLLREQLPAGGQESPETLGQGRLALEYEGMVGVLATMMHVKIEP